jgi:hypothetical protein
MSSHSSDIPSNAERMSEDSKSDPGLAALKREMPGLRIDKGRYYVVRREGGRTVRRKLTRVRAGEARLRAAYAKLPALTRRRAQAPRPLEAPLGSHVLTISHLKLLSGHEEAGAVVMWLFDMGIGFLADKNGVPFTTIEALTDAAIKSDPQTQHLLPDYEALYAPQRKSKKKALGTSSSQMFAGAEKRRAR